jgi:hypothetical protein
MHVHINVKSPNNISKWEMGFNSAFKGLIQLVVDDPMESTQEISKQWTFIYPCIASISLNYNQQDAPFSLSIYFYKSLYIFQAVPPSIIRSTKLYIQRQVL